MRRAIRITRLSKPKQRTEDRFTNGRRRAGQTLHWNAGAAHRGKAHRGDTRDELSLHVRLKDVPEWSVRTAPPASPFYEVTLLSSATRGLVKTMTPQTSRLLVRNTGLGVGDRREQGGFLFDKIIMPLLKVYKDKNRHEDIVRGSCLDCVLVLPIVLNDKAANQTFQSEVDLSAIHGGTISRADVARFAVEELTNNTWL
jgi:hypothetical protein